MLFFPFFDNVYYHIYSLQKGDHQPGVADGMVRGAEGMVLDQGCVRRKLDSHRINAGDVQGFVAGPTRQGARQQGRREVYLGQKTVAFSLTLATALIFRTRTNEKGKLKPAPLGNTFECQSA
jgi:hypothetical protein